MIGPRLTISKGARDEAEKPFWISYADLMTSLMVLFLVVMIVSIVAIAAQRKQVNEVKQEAEQVKRDNAALIGTGQKAELASKQQAVRDAKIATFEATLRARLAPLDATIVEHRVQLGKLKVNFEDNEAKLDSTEQQYVRNVVERVVDTSLSDGKGLLSRVDVEGFASETGDYFTNLSISLFRSEALMCAVLTGPKPVADGLSELQQVETAALFAIGGRSSNDLMPTPDQSKRIELVLQYVGIAPSPTTQITTAAKAFDYNNPGNCRVP